jgi:hypothetical protein
MRKDILKDISGMASICWNNLTEYNYGKARDEAIAIKEIVDHPTVDELLLSINELCLNLTKIHHNIAIVKAMQLSKWINQELSKNSDDENHL